MRKAVPHLIRDTHQHLFGQRHEVKLTLPKTVPEAQARRQFADWLATVEARFAVCRAALGGKGVDLTHRQAHALAGRWYGWYAGNFENCLGEPALWRTMRETYRDALKRQAEERGSGEPNFLVQRALIDRLSKRLGLDEFLATERMVLCDSGKARFLDAVAVQVEAVWSLLERQAGGDYTPDDRPKTFPEFDPQPRPSAAGLSPIGLFRAYVDAKPRSPGTVNQWRSNFTQMETYFEGRSVESMLRADLTGWLSRLSQTCSERTIWTSHVASAKTVTSWAVTTGLLRANPFAQLKAPRGAASATRLREKQFRTHEAEMILRAALASSDKAMNAELAAALRWVPWVCAYTGARPGEICQLRGQDVFEYAGAWALRITPEAGTVKNKKARIVPVHVHLIEQGFLDFVKRSGSGPLFYAPERLRRKLDEKPVDSLRPRRHPAERIRTSIAEWVRRPYLTPVYSLMRLQIACEALTERR